ncbi:MAG TPA: response regulator transcription factor [Burkholderiaceae bacterium]|jgi:DNA-binding NarL/FixJ family response regulator|nr:response regulator transcription factor [Burkholderiaceae bacterium]
MNVLIADDHPLVRDALARTVQQLSADVQVRQAGDLDGLLRLAAQGDADLALVDLNMPGMDGIVGLRRLRDAAPTLPIVVASGQEDPMTIRAVLAAGAVGFIPKSERSEVLLGALRLVQAGGTYVPSRLLDSTARPPPTDLHSAELTPRQLDVLRCLLRGEPNKLIARELGLTEGTVKIHIAAILRALHARNRTEAVVRARALGIAREA